MYHFIPFSSNHSLVSGVFLSVYYLAGATFKKESRLQILLTVFFQNEEMIDVNGSNIFYK